MQTPTRLDVGPSFAVADPTSPASDPTASSNTIPTTFAPDLALASAQSSQSDPWILVYPLYYREFADGTGKLIVNCLPNRCQFARIPAYDLSFYYDGAESAYVSNFAEYTFPDEYRHALKIVTAAQTFWFEIAPSVSTPESQPPTSHAISGLCYYATRYCTYQSNSVDPEGQTLWFQWDMYNDGSVEVQGTNQRYLGYTHPVGQDYQIRVKSRDPLFWAREEVWNFEWPNPSNPPVPAITTLCDYDDGHGGTLTCTLYYTGSGGTPTKYHWYVLDNEAGGWRKSVAETLTQFTYEWHPIDEEDIPVTVGLIIEWPYAGPHSHFVWGLGYPD